MDLELERSRPGQETDGAFLICLFVWVCSAFVCDNPSLAFWARTSFVLAIGNVLFTAWYPAWREPERTTFWSEMCFAAQEPLETFGPAFFFWPIWFVLALWGHTYRTAYTESFWRRNGALRGIHSQTVHEWCGQESAKIFAQGKSVGEAVTNATDFAAEMPAVACRAAVLSTALAGAATPVCAQQHSTPSLVATSQVMNMKLLKNGGVPYRQPIIQGDLTASWSGFFLNLYGQDNFRGHGKPGRQETDLTAGWGNKNFQLGVTYKDRTPFLRDGNGNLVNPFIEADLAWESGSHKLTPFARFEWYHALRHSGVNNGAFAIGGLKHRWQLSDGVSADQVLWALYDSSVFRSDTGVMGRYKLAVHILIGHGIAFDPLIFELSAPISGIKDRKIEPVVGAGVSIRFN